MDMTSSRMIHAAWAGIALLAFGAGSYLSRRPDVSTVSPGARIREAPPLPEGVGPAGGPGYAVPAGGASSRETDANVPRKPLTRTEIEAIGKEAFNDPNPLKRNLAFSKLLESMTPENVMDVMETMKSNGAEGNHWQLFRYAWGAMDGAGAMTFAATLEGREKQRFIADALTGWAGSTPAEAISWLEGLADGEEKERFRASVVGGLADRDIGEATNYVFQRAQLGDKRAENFLAIVAGEEIRKNGTAHAIQWAENLPDGPLRGAALDRVAGSYVREDPQAAAAWAEKFVSTPHGGRVIEEVADEWAERDPVAAVSWLDKLPESAGRSEGMFSALQEWTQRDPTAASHYLAAMPASDARDSAVSGFTRVLAREDPEAAVIWASTISSGEARLRAIIQAGRSWYRQDASSATAWIENASLPPEARARIMEPPRRNGRRS